MWQYAVVNILWKKMKIVLINLDCDLMTKSLDVGRFMSLSISLLQWTYLVLFFKNVPLRLFTFLTKICSYTTKLQLHIYLIRNLITG